MRWDPNREDDLFLNQSAILYANYYQLQMVIHREFIPSPRRPLANANLPLPSMAICVNAARACLRVLDVQHRRAKAASGGDASGVTIYALTPLQMPLFTVGIMLLVYLWCGARDARSALDDVDVCLSILRDLSEACVARPQYLLPRVPLITSPSVEIWQRESSSASDHHFLFSGCSLIF